MAAPPLPLVDEHSVDIAATGDEVWAALLDTVDRDLARSPAAAYARLVGCEPSSSSGPRPLTPGSTIPGFRVVNATAPAVFVLEGRHRFSRYALTFRLDTSSPASTRITAETRAEFPGVLGGAYRLLVIGTRGHVVAVRRLLGAVRRRALTRRARTAR